MQADVNDDRIRHNGRVRPKPNNDDKDVLAVQRGSRNNSNNDVRSHHENRTSVAETAKEGTPTSRHFIIDNTQKIYIPIRLRCGITVMYQQDIFEQPQWFQQIQMILQTDVSYCLQVLPISVRSLIRRTKIWLNLNNYYYFDPQTNQPTYVNHSTTHHHVAWLVCARDRPDKVLGIEIYNIYDYIRMRHHWNGSGLLLHEYCHLIHQHVFGLDSVRIQTLYRQAQQSQLYNTVLRRDWAGGGNGSGTTTNGMDTDLAYCMMDCKEFFAELSVTYLAKHSLFHYLDTACSTRMADCSPPITEPTVIQRLQHSNSKIKIVSSTTNDRPIIIKWIETVKRYLLLTSYDTPPHCNKFYPFTSGQFRHYDPSLYAEIQKLWCDVAAWEDPHDNTNNNILCTTCRWINHTWIQRQHNKNEYKVIVDVDIESPLIPSTINDTVDL